MHSFPAGFKTFSCFAVAIVGGLLASIGQAQIVALTSGNSYAAINLSSQAGMFDWRINGQSQLNQQWFWFRVGNDPTGQHSLDTLPHTFSQNANSLNATYTAINFSINIAYQLTGGQAGGSDWHSEISESISLQNTSGGMLDLHFFQYSDFSLAGWYGGERAQIFQNDGFFTKATVVKAGSNIAETIDEPLANHAEAGLTSDSPNTRDRLNSGVPINLNGNLTAGPDVVADATWALQWDFLGMAPGEIDNVLKDKKITVTPIPEPGTLAMWSLGLAAFIFYRRRLCA